MVARGWGKPCICGCGDLKIDSVAKTLVIRAQKGTGKRDITLREGEIAILLTTKLDSKRICRRLDQHQR